MLNQPGDTALTTPQNTRDLMALIQQEWEALMRTVEKCSPAQMLKPGPGGWSVKDNLAHLYSWERYMILYHLDGIPPHQVMQIDEATFEKVGEDGLNAIIFERNNDRSVEDVLETLQNSHALVVARLESMPFDELLKPHYPGDPDTRPLLVWVTGNTYEHYREHRKNIEALTCGQ